MIVVSNLLIVLGNTSIIAIFNTVSQKRKPLAVW